MRTAVAAGGWGSADWPCHRGEHRRGQRVRKSGLGSMQDRGWEKEKRASGGDGK